MSDVGPKQNSSGRYRAWCYTLNNYSEEDVHRLDGIVSNGDAKYHCRQPERGESGTPHIQGYLVFANGKRLSGVKRLVGQRAHVEPAKGSADQNREYCSKEDSADTAAVCGGEPLVFAEFGEFPAGTGCGSGM